MGHVEDFENQEFEHEIFDAYTSENDTCEVL